MKTPLDDALAELESAADKLAALEAFHPRDKGDLLARENARLLRDMAVDRVVQLQKERRHAAR